MTGMLKRQWYAAVWVSDLQNGKSVARTILGEPVLIWRADDGSVSALADACPHRLAPLSLGQVDGEGVRCGYHGLKFDRTGRCIDNPHGPVTRALSARAYPVQERHAMIWIWMGDADVAEPAQIPDLSFIDRTRPTAISKGYLYTRADHRLLEDNILDLSHADYLHTETLGGGSITRSRAKVEERGDTVFVQWLASNERAIPIFRPLMSSPDALTDMWTEVQWHPNGVMILRVGATGAGKPQDRGIDTWNAHIMTPERDGSTHYFYVNTRNYRVDDAQFNAEMAAGLRHAFEIEDKPMIEAQQERLGTHDLFELSPKLLSIDNGSTRARRVYQRLVAAEQALAATAGGR